MLSEKFVIEKRNIRNCMCITNTTVSYESLSGYVQEISREYSSLEEEQLDDCVRNLSINSSSPLSKTNLILSPPSSPRLISQGPPTAKDIVLRRCGQIEPIPFQQCYSPR